MSRGWRGVLASALVALLLASVMPAAAAAATPRCGAAAKAPPRAATDHQLRTSVLCLVNLTRERHGIAPLAYSLALRQSATAHSKAMVSSGFLSHYGPSGSTPAIRIVRSGYLARATSYRVAENIAVGRGRGYGSPLAIVRAWMSSPNHRQNLLDPRLRDFGVGIARGRPSGGDANAATYTLDLAARRR
jgi:uncharacterized protein YkwD